MKEDVGRHVPSRCEVVTYPEFELVGSEGSYVSLDGMFLESSACLDVGTEVVVSLNVPGTERWIDAEGRVSRVVQVATDVRGVGVRFERMDDSDRSALEAALAPEAPDDDEVDRLDVSRELSWMGADA